MGNQTQQEERYKQRCPNQKEAEQKGLESLIIHTIGFGQNRRYADNALPDGLSTGNNMLCRRLCLFSNLAGYRWFTCIRRSLSLRLGCNFTFEPAEQCVARFFILQNADQIINAAGRF